MTKENLENINALLNKFWFMLENDNSPFKAELQPQIEKQIENIKKEVKNG